MEANPGSRHVRKFVSIDSDLAAFGPLQATRRSSSRLRNIRSPHDSRTDTQKQEDRALPEAEEPGELAEAVARLYQVFASRPRRAGIEFDACDQDASPQERRELARTPLRDLKAGLLSTFILNATSWTWGTPDDMWYYLPRILELVAARAACPQRPMEPVPRDGPVLAELAARPARSPRQLHDVAVACHP